MDGAEGGTELLENVVINDVGAPQYMIQRLPENSQLLSSELLQHNGLVVDLTAGDFIPVSYPSEALLSHDLTEEDRNLAAALVAVQLSQQQKQQQLHDATLPSLGNKLLEDQQLILSDNLYIDKQTLAKIQNENGFASQNFDSGLVTEKSEDEKKASDGENRFADNLPVVGDRFVGFRNDARSSRKSLPHKKRISRKLKKNCPTTMKVQCNQCEQTFTSTDDFAQHELLCQTTITPVHAGTAAFSCQLCSAAFQDQLRFFEHLKSHYEPVSQDMQQLQHVGKVEPDAEKDTLLTNLLSLTCMCCNKTFRKQKTFDQHVKDVHHKDENNEFSETEDLMEGINVVVENNEQASDNDSKAWYREEDLHQTEEDLKELEATEHICHICKQPFPLRAILLQHLVTCRANTGNTEASAPSIVKKYRKRGNLHCTECDRVFTHRNSLVYHLRSHSGIRPHQCDQCGKSFFASSALKVHLRLHSGDKPYHCEECGKNFRQWGDLKYHMTSLHSNERQFQCEYCGKDFARKYSLIVHRRIHTGEKNYKCEYCNKSFRASSYLQNHRKIHTGEKPHECEICGKPFRVRSDMKRHQKTHHSKRLSAKPLRFPNAQTIIKTKVESDNPEDVSVNVVTEDSTSQILSTYEQEQLESSVRDGSTLYSHGPQLFLVSYSTDVKNVDTSTWIHTAS